jgi:small multidrug resistance pump
MGAAIVFEVIATTALKSSEGFSRLGPSLIVLAGYAVSFYLFSLALRTLPVGIAYALWGGLGIVLVTLLAWVVHGQKLDGWAVLGIGMIIGGVAILNLLSKSGQH